MFSVGMEIVLHAAFVVLGIAFLPFTVIIHGGWGIPLGLAMLVTDLVIAQRVGLRVRAARAITGKPNRGLELQAVAYVLLSCAVLHGAVLFFFDVFTDRIR